MTPAASVAIWRSGRRLCRAAQTEAKAPPSIDDEAGGAECSGDAGSDLRSRTVGRQRGLEEPDAAAVGIGDRSREDAVGLVGQRRGHEPRRGAGRLLGGCVAGGLLELEVGVGDDAALRQNQQDRVGSR